MFIGLIPGVYDTWALAMPQVHSVKGAVFLGYARRGEADRAYQYAKVRGWVSRVQNGRHMTLEWGAPQATPTISHPFATPLTVGIPNKRWYCVYRGLSPGVYRT